MTDVAEERELDADFGRRPPQDVVVEGLVRGRSRRDIAAELGVELTTVHTHVAQAVREWSGGAGTYRERIILEQLRLEDITKRAYDALAEPHADVVALLTVLLRATGLRVQMLVTVERRAGGAS